jgi:hypothetical protein
MQNVPLNRIAIVMAVAFGLVAMLRYVMTRHPKVETDAEGETGRIAPNRALLAVISLIGVALAVAASYSWARGLGGWPLLAVAIAALLMTAMMVTSFFPVFDITWDENGIEGPTLLLPPPVGPRRARLYWEDLEKTGNVQGRHWFLEDDKGRRIVWSFIYYGYPALLARVEEECPWLFTETKPETDSAKTALDPEALPPLQKRRIRLPFATAKSA